ncbi:hypothetical protein [Phenylobacterium aquaticum]|uniref:hypothetical protein n=1 Tax=Phenylobacterium aquaticum TaxID=1763816 RepID=UPI0026F11E94|nr:hypothetical protein [Phenylobacterium aquaticum]
MTSLQNLISPGFDDKTYGAGLSIFQGVLIAVGDPEENARFERRHNKVGRISAPGGGPRDRFLSLSVALPPSELEGLNVDGVRLVFCQLMSAALKAPPLKLPAGFAHGEFARDLDIMLSLAAAAALSP